MLSCNRLSGTVFAEFIVDQRLTLDTTTSIYIKQGPNVNDTENYLYHVRFVTFVFGFPDDLFVLLNPINERNVAVWIQGAAREGFYTTF